MHVFGPVPSRRLGKSVGVNNIPPKICTYSCMYCQLGHSLKMMVDRQEYFAPELLRQEAEKKIADAQKNNEPIDYLTIVPDGEPTLDSRLGELIRELKPLGIKIAVITNSSLMDVPDVRDDLMAADWVSVKVDAVEEKIWRTVDHPHRQLNLDAILNGIRTFADQYAGTLVSETMLVAGINDDPQHLERVASYLGEIDPAIAYISIPIRPPADSRVCAPDEARLTEAWHMYDQKVKRVELLIGYEGNEFAYTGNVEEDLLSITSVHPMREDAVRAYLSKAKADFSVIDALVKDGKLTVTVFNEERFYARNLRRDKDHPVA